MIMGLIRSAANHHYIFENVVETLKGKNVATTNALEGLKVVEIIEKIYKLRDSKMKIYDKLISKDEKLAVVGLGYVGLPIALEFAKKLDVIGFDINVERVNMMKQNIDPSNELIASNFENCSITFTSNLKDLQDAKFFIIAVPTPIDKNKKPDINPLVSASKTVGKVLKKDYVVYESTVYPGCTEEDCIPVLEELSGLTFKKDFKVGYSQKGLIQEIRFIHFLVLLRYLQVVIKNLLKKLLRLMNW